MPYAHPSGFPPRALRARDSPARDRPSPYGKGRRFFTAARGLLRTATISVARGPRRFPSAHPSGFPPRSPRARYPGEGQALALR